LAGAKLTAGAQLDQLKNLKARTMTALAFTF
jgi:hypothetical protein